jgi:hypothetical protein
MHMYMYAFTYIHTRAHMHNHRYVVQLRSNGWGGDKDRVIAQAGGRSGRLRMDHVIGTHNDKDAPWITGADCARKVYIYVYIHAYVGRPKSTGAPWSCTLCCESVFECTCVRLCIYTCIYTYV